MRKTKLSIVVQSHLSDAMLEMSFMPALAQKRIAFVKELLIDCPDLEQEVSEDDLNIMWSRMETPKHRMIEDTLEVPDDEVVRQIEDLLEEDWDEKDSVSF